MGGGEEENSSLSTYATPEAPGIAMAPIAPLLVATIPTPQTAQARQKHKCCQGRARLGRQMVKEGARCGTPTRNESSHMWKGQTARVHVRCMQMVAGWATTRCGNHPGSAPLAAAGLHYQLSTEEAICEVAKQTKKGLVAMQKARHNEEQHVKVCVSMKHTQ